MLTPATGIGCRGRLFFARPSSAVRATLVRRLCHRPRSIYAIKLHSECIWKVEDQTN